MEQKTDWRLSEEEKKSYIKQLTDDLVTLRAKAGIPQEELSRIIGVSRQTYGAIERKDKEMSWNTYLALLFFFDHNNNTHQLLRQMGTFPERLISHINNGEQDGTVDVSGLGEFPIQEILDSLDEQGVHSVKTLLMVEYARCKQMPGDAVIKSFDGRTFSEDITEDQEEIAKAIRKIKEKRNSGA